jgi:hypothetical protein
VFDVIKTGRKVAGAGALALLFAAWAPINAFACSTANPTGGGSASGGGSALASGGGYGVPLGSIGFGGLTFAALSGLVLLAAVVVLAILLVKTLRPRPNWALMARLSPDGRYWWDGTTWHDRLQNPLPPSVRSADGAHWWDGGSWRSVPAG